MQYDWTKIAEKPAENKSIIAENTVAKLTVKGNVYFLANRNGEYFAGDNRCPHAGAALHTGWLNETGQIVCPFHRFCFDLENGRSKEGFCVATYPIELREDGVYMGLPKKKWYEFW